MKNIVKNFGALLLVLVLTAGALPMTALAADYSSYVGLWTYSEDRTSEQFSDFTLFSELDIKSISDGCVSFDLTGGRVFSGVGPTRVAEVLDVTSDAISNNQAAFRYEDSWGNTGHGVITFREDGVMVSLTEEKVGAFANYSIAMTPLDVLLQKNGYVADPVAADTPGVPGIVRSPQKLNVDGVDVDCEKYNIGGSNYFKLRDLACMLSGTVSQFDVGYDAHSSTVAITTGAPYTPNGTELNTDADNSATAQPSSQTILIDGVEHSELTVYNIGGSNFFQLRELGSVLGFDVDYEADTDTALIYSPLLDLAY